MKNLKRIGKIALCKCPLSHKTYGVRFEKVGKAWKYDWAFRISLQAASREHYDETKLVGKVVMDNKYPGCPYCKAIGFIICDCGHLNCYNIKGDRFMCEWCKQEGILGGEYTGSGFASGGDL
ncbi:TerY-C metal binding domain-containing protein [Anaerovibrio sp.]|uniref:TerY-C metal binding domain-containing protein n=1 Tax=Anaerovibrio sp. TaxID=1872532 RepID=UPI0025B7D535|nr:TerY-C metal binding domain-containing protein [Anaerovibrio sp.]MBR2142082.1 hypothetical protein [Anaerovibrio sp.]